ncbi:hypothetical protein HanXRQr2_Chr17g0799941 [Helianthus annuus]|uniref:Uncharacterized protein n=1 Tax=Helianthus annuus TaxID=4232 RepID=A0A9K3DID1_HELAN|nr:hypothetical protein HanXRQr2_Chr17g0799941 [Helianthus annuus]KAJ0812925.1 hypothetical protein HanPSC8_Chr17g0767541 [Helianthus annuus]
MDVQQVALGARGHGACRGRPCFINCLYDRSQAQTASLSKVSASGVLTRPALGFRLHARGPPESSCQETYPQVARGPH